jgi:glycosyltransferase involved in cell wall biosynthesis
LEPNSDEDDINLVFAGNIGEMQSIDTIVKAAKEIQDMCMDSQPTATTHFHIVGDGSALEKNINLAKDFGLKNITFHGRHPLEDMPKFYDMADAFVVTLKNDEFISYTLPGKIQSYMASGKPIIGAINGETAIMINESCCGLSCDAEDYEALVKIILQFAEDKENRQKYGDCSKAYYESNFSSDSFFSNLINYLSIES